MGNVSVVVVVDCVVVFVVDMAAVVVVCVVVVFVVVVVIVVVVCVGNAECDIDSWMVVSWVLVKTECCVTCIGCIVVGVGHELEIDQSDILGCVDRPGVVVVVGIVYYMEVVEIDARLDCCLFVFD